MKKKILVLTVPLLLVAVLAAIYLFNGCRKEVEPISTYKIVGKVVDSETNAPLANVSISVDGFSKELSTNQEGFFSFNVVKHQDYNATAQKEGFVDKTFCINRTSSGFYSCIVKMKPSGTTVSIGANGGLIATNNYNNDNLQIEIPTGALSSTKSLSATSVWGNECPKMILNDVIPVDVLFLSPENTTLEKDATVSLTAPFELGNKQDLTIYKYNFKSRTWDVLETDITINGSLAIFKISSFGLYSLGINGSYSEKITQEYTETVQLSESGVLYLKPTLTVRSDLNGIPIEYFEGIVNQYYQIEFNKINSIYLNDFDHKVSTTLKSTATTTYCFDICHKKITTTICVNIKIRGIPVKLCIPIDLDIPYPCNFRKCHDGGSSNP